MGKVKLKAKKPSLKMKEKEHSIEIFELRMECITNMCAECERTAFSMIDSGNDNKEQKKEKFLKKIDKKNLKDWKKPDEWYCNRHAEE